MDSGGKKPETTHAADVAPGGLPSLDKAKADYRKALESLEGRVASVVRAGLDAAAPPPQGSAPLKPPVAGIGHLADVIRNGGEGNSGDKKTSDFGGGVLPEGGSGRPLGRLLKAAAVALAFAAGLAALALILLLAGG